MNSDLQLLFIVQFLKCKSYFFNRVVLAAVMIPHNADDSDCAVVNTINCFVWIDLHSFDGGLDEPRLDVHVSEEFLPACLVHGRDHEVRPLPHGDRGFPSVAPCEPRLPALLESDSREQARLCAADGPRTGERAVPRHLAFVHRAVPQPRDHIDALVVDPPAARVDVLVRDIHLEPHHRDVRLLGLEHHIDVGRRVQSLVEIERVLVRDALAGVWGRHPPLRHARLLLRLRAELAGEPRRIVGRQGEHRS
mmetsp:Transcript_115/g.268  ORF Transcript_115/g.268 Transcript_115/m.268 type:complete len:250 (+) Transcript_115:848-1597(+)